MKDSVEVVISNLTPEQAQTFAAEAKKNWPRGLQVEVKREPVFLIEKEIAAVNVALGKIEDRGIFYCDDELTTVVQAQRELKSARSRMQLFDRLIETVVEKITKAEDALAKQAKKAGAAVALLFLVAFLFPANAQAQDSHSLNSNEHAPTINNGMKPALPLPPASGSASSSTGSSASSGASNDGEYEQSTFVEYKDALKQGQQQKAEVAKPKTLGEIARENREAKAKAAAAPKAKVKVEN